MLKSKNKTQSKLEMVSLEQLVPKDHLLRKIDRAIDFSFIREKVSHLYCPDNGRPALDPEVLFKMLFIGYLFGIRSERQLVREVEVNLAYRWFLGFDLTEKVPDASTFSQNRRRRFLQSNIYQEIFDEIVMQAIGRKLVEGKTLYTDSTHLKASANKNKFSREQVEKSTASYLGDLDRDVENDRKKHGKKPLKSAEKPEDNTKVCRVSTTDQDAGYMVRSQKEQCFCYLDHRTVDGKFNIITDSFVTPGNVHDSIPYIERLDRQTRRFDFTVESVGLDAGYFTAALCKGLEERDIFGVIAYRRPNKKKDFLSKREYFYNRAGDYYRCPNGQHLTYRTTTRQGYKEYVSDPKKCSRCRFLSRCTESANRVKVVTRHIWEESKEHIIENRLSDRGKAIYKRRKETVERSFADAKQLHGHRYARMRGLKKVMEQCLLSAACQNMKKIALAVFLWRFLQINSGFFAECEAKFAF